MEIEIHGNLMRSADGVGYRAFAMGERGIKEQARLLDMSNLSKLVEVAALWRIASVVVAQKHLHDINQNLSEIKATVGAIGTFQRDDQRSKIESNYEYLFQIEKSLAAGERSNAVRLKIEFIETEMDSAQRHLRKLFDQNVCSRVADSEMFGVDKLAINLAAKAQDVETVVQDYILASMTRLGALQMLGLFPGDDVLKIARVEDVGKSIAIVSDMCKVFEKSLTNEVVSMNSKSEIASTLLKGGLLNLGSFFKGAPSQIRRSNKLQQKSIVVSKSMGNTYIAPGRIVKKAELETLPGEKLALAPKLDAKKRKLTEKIEQRAALIMKRIHSMSLACNSAESFLSNSPIRYIVEFNDGVPVRIIEARKLR